MKKEILLLGDSKLYEISEPVCKEEIQGLLPLIEDLHDTLILEKNMALGGR